MKYNLLGRTGLLVSDLCLGTMIFGEENSRGTPADQATAIIHRYLDAGGNHLDTANVYAGGRSEEIVGQAIKDRRAQVVLATKVRFGGELNTQGLSRFHILQAVEASLKRLATDYLDLYYVHCWDPLTPLEETLRALDDLVTSGKVRYIGVSNFKAWQLMKALAVSDSNGYARFVAGQYQYSLVKRDIEYEFTDLCLSEGVGITPWSPLGGGFLSGKYKRGDRPQDLDNGRIAMMPDDVEEAWDRRATERNWNVIEAIGQIVEARGVTYSQVALAWLRAQPAVSSTIIGVRTMAQLEDNLGAAELNLTGDELQTLDQASALPEMYPYRFIQHYGYRTRNLNR
ncbi:MAG: aldo/keto reductase [Anaerolineae bacterium]|jgi:aryl-alcohol dehydrogenase-like predicted oxidoreductase|nr:aldo/keto reductase [Anaerolineae bacterium]